MIRANLPTAEQQCPAFQYSPREVRTPTGFGALDALMDWCDQHADRDPHFSIHWNHYTRRGDFWLVELVLDYQTPWIRESSASLAQALTRALMRAMDS